MEKQHRSTVQVVEEAKGSSVINRKRKKSTNIPHYSNLKQGL